MPVHNAEIAERLERLADLLEIEGANPFRIRAYRNAARTVSGLSESLAEMLAEGRDLSELPDIGEAIAAKIEDFVSTGHLAKLEEVESRIPAALSDLMKIEGLGPKRVKALYHELNIRSIEDLARAARSGRIHELDGFGNRTEQLILERAQHFHGGSQRMRLADAEEYVRSLVDYLQRIPGVGEVTVAGSFRRCRDTVGDIDILVTARNGKAVIDRFTAYDEVREIVSHGSTRSTVILRCALQVDLRVVQEESYGAALCYFTGSKAHNIAIRTIAVKKGYKLNEYGLFRGETRIGGTTEQDIYKAIGLSWIAPELRENRGEIEAAIEGRLPTLIECGDIRGDLHSHTDATDGHDSLEAMVEAARARGYEYLAITDHSRHVTVAHGLDESRLREQLERIDRLNARLKGFRILKSAEVDILEDGSLDLPDAVLKELDFTLCAIHYGLRLSSAKQTERIIRAMDNPCFTILAHPSGRLINEREPCAVDMEKVMREAKTRGCFVEVDSQPSRLDLTDSGCRIAKDLGLKVSIASDAHSGAQLDLMRYGIGQARRGWLEAGDVLNTLPLAQLLKQLQRR